MWDVESGAETLVFRGHSGSVLGAAISPGGQFVVVAGATERRASGTHRLAAKSARSTGPGEIKSMRSHSAPTVGIVTASTRGNAVGIQVRTARGQHKRLDPARCHDRSEGLGVLGVAIVQEIAAVPQRAASLHGHVPGDLLHPPLVRRER